MNEINSLNYISLITLGESSVGKSSIINRYTENASPNLKLLNSPIWTKR